MTGSGFDDGFDGGFESGIDYATRAQTALLDMVRGVMAETAEKGLPGAHHFYITFATRAEGVQLSDTLLAQHEREMTIVLQNQFEDLQVSETGFSVTLYFDGVAETLRVPFTALRKFFDPSVGFGLAFDETFDEASDDAEQADSFATDLTATDMADDIDAQTPDNNAESPSENKGGEVVSLDSFRDK